MSGNRKSGDSWGESPWGKEEKSKERDWSESPYDRKLNDKEELMQALDANEYEFKELYEEKKAALIKEHEWEDGIYKPTKEEIYAALWQSVPKHEPLEIVTPATEKVSTEINKRFAGRKHAQAFVREALKKAPPDPKPEIKIDEDFVTFKNILADKLKKYAEGRGLKVHKARAIEVSYAIRKATSKEIALKILDTQLKVLKGENVTYDQTLGVSQRFATVENVKRKVNTKLDEWASGYWKIIKEAHDMNMQEYLKKAGKDKITPSKSPKI